jgi:hypothetical protein
MMRELKVVSAELHRLADGIGTRQNGSTLESLVEASEVALGEAKQAKADLVARHRLELRAANRGIEAIEAALSDLRVKRRRAGRRTRVRSARVQAGPAAIQAVTDRLKVGPVSQKQLVVDTGLNEGTVSTAIRALIEAGAAELTGRVVEGSRELRFVRGKTAVARGLYARAREITVSKVAV